MSSLDLLTLRTKNFTFFKIVFSIKDIVQDALQCDCIRLVGCFKHLI